MAKSLSEISLACPLFLIFQMFYPVTSVCSSSLWASPSVPLLLLINLHTSAHQSSTVYRLQLYVAVFFATFSVCQLDIIALGKQKVYLGLRFIIILSGKHLYLCQIVCMHENCIVDVS